MSIRYFTEWTKHSAYVLQARKDTGLYITSAPKAERVTYNPFDCADEILLELLSIGKGAGEPTAEHRVLGFCVRYGLLGLAQAVMEKEYEDGTAKLYQGNVLGVKAISDRELRDLFFPQDARHRAYGGDPMSITARWESECDLWQAPYPLFRDRYGERVDWLVAYAAQLYDTLLRFYRGEAFTYPPGNVRCELRYDGAVYTVWRFDSLKSAIDIMFVELLRNTSPPVKLCARCHKPFRAAVGHRSVYCSASCRNVENVKRSRQRRKDALIQS